MKGLKKYILQRLIGISQKATQWILIAEFDDDKMYVCTAWIKIDEWFMPENYDWQHLPVADPPI